MNRKTRRDGHDEIELKTDQDQRELEDLDIDPTERQKLIEEVASAQPDLSDYSEETFDTRTREGSEKLAKVLHHDYTLGDDLEKEVYSQLEGREEVRESQIVGKIIKNYDESDIGIGEDLDLDRKINTDGDYGNIPDSLFDEPVVKDAYKQIEENFE